MPRNKLTRSSPFLPAAVVLTLMVLPSPAFGGTGHTREKCVEIGLRNSTAIRNAERDRGIAHAKISQAWSAALPSISLRSSYTRLDEVQTIDFQGIPVEMGIPDNYLVAADITQPLYSGGKTRAALKAAGYAGDYAEHAHADSKAMLIRDIRVSFNNVLLARATVRIQQESLAQLEDLRDAARLKLKNGAVSEFDVMSAEVQVANEVPALIAASNRYQLAVAALKNLIGDDTEDFDVAGELEYVPVTVSLETLQQTAQSRPLALAAQTVVHLREQDLAVTRGQDKPSINATFSYNGANSSGFVSYEDDWQWHWNAGLTLQWNLWDGGRTRGMVREKKLELEKASDALVDLNRLTDLEATQAHLDMIAAAESIAGTEKGIDLAESTMKLARSRYEQGLVTHLEYTASSLALSRARFMRLQALCSHMNAVARLQYACGLDDDAFERLCRGEQDNSGEINAD